MCIVLSEVKLLLITYFTRAVHPGTGFWKCERAVMLIILGFGVTFLCFPNMLEYT